jgi:hypothetical protein
MAYRWMKTLLIIVSVLFTSVVSVAQTTLYWIGSGSNWNTTSSWSASSGGASCNCVPGVADEVIFDNASGNCVISSSVSIAGITLTSAFTGAISLFDNASDLTSTGSSVFAGGTITDGGTGASVILTTGTGSTTFAGTIFDVAVSGSSGDLFFNGSRFKKDLDITKTVSNINSSLGGNTFEASTTIQVAGGAIRLATGSAGDVFTNTSQLSVVLLGASAQFFPSSEKNASTFDCPVNITYGTSTGIVDFGNSQTATASPMISTMSVGITSLTCASGCGALRIARMIHGASQTIDLLTSSNSTLTLGPNATFNGAAINFAAPSIILNGSTFSAASVTSLTQTGSSTGSSTFSVGGNTFNGVTTMTNSGTGYWVMNGTGALLPDVFNNTLTLYNTGTGRIFMADGATGNIFNGDIILNNSTTTGGIYFSDNIRGNATNTGRSTHSSGTVSIGAFSTGTLRFKYFTDTQSLNLTQTTGSAILYLSTGSVFQNAVISFPNIKLNGATYHGTTSLIKNSSATENDDCAGGNVFNGATTINNQSTFHWALAYGSSGTGGPGDTFNSTLIVNNSAAGKIQLSHLGTSATFFNGDVTFRSSNSSGIITIGTAGGSGAVLGASARLLATTTDFTAGSLYLSNISQASSSVTNTMQIVGNLYIGTFRNVSIGGNLTISANLINIGTSSSVNAQLLGNNNIATNGSLNLSYSTFGSSPANTTSIVKNGSSTGNDLCTGGNTFNGVTTFQTISPSGILTLANTAGDTFNSHVIFNSYNTTSLRPAFRGDNYFYGNISVNTGISIGTTSSWVIMSGSADQTISTSGANPIFRRLKMDKSGSGAVTIVDNSFVRIGSMLDFTSGLINTSALGRLIFLNGSVYTNASNSSYVDGPARKIGTETFTFPVGKDNLYRPISISAPSASSEFSAEYFNVSPSAMFGSTGLPSGRRVSECQYWALQRTAGTSSVNVTLYWFSTACSPISNNNTSELTVSRWNGTQWNDIAQSSSSGNNISGSVTIDNQDIPSATPFGITSSQYSLPVTLISFDGQLQHDNTITLKWRTGDEKNNMGFEILKSSDGRTFQRIAFVPGQGDTEIVTTYEFVDLFVQSKNYYRLNQVDIDGKSALSGIIFVPLESKENIAEIWPNPFRESFQLKLVGNELAEEIFIAVLDPCGKVVYSWIGSVNSFNRSIASELSFLSPGVYFIQISTGSIRVTEKITKL